MLAFADTDGPWSATELAALSVLGSELSRVSDQWKIVGGPCKECGNHYFHRVGCSFNRGNHVLQRDPVLVEATPEASKALGLPTDDKERKRLKLFTYLMEYFPDAFLAEVEVAVRGNEQHNPGEPLHWARDKSNDQLNTAFRHLFDYGRGVKKDTDGQYHLAKAIWRLKAQLQLDIEAERNEDVRDH